LFNSFVFFKWRRVLRLTHIARAETRLESFKVEDPERKKIYLRQLCTNSKA
jgi:hypothetical protein